MSLDNITSKDYIKDTDIDQDTLNDLNTKNTNRLSTNNIWDFLDWFISQQDLIRPFITKNNGMSLFKNSLKEQNTVIWKRFVVLNFLLSRFTSDFQKNYVITDWFSIDSIKLIRKFQEENKLIADGIFWEKSLKILKQKCNIWEKNTNTSNKNKNVLQLSDSTILNKIDKINLDECAQYVTQSIMELHDASSSKSIYTTITWVIWNARTMFDNITSRAWKNLGNIFTIDKPSSQDPNVIKEHVRKLFSINESIIKDIKRKKWDIVWLFYPKSSNHIKANTECEKTCNTHVGYIRWFTVDGIPIVSHNIHWTVYNQPINELYDTSDQSNWCVVRWARPNLLSSLAQNEIHEKNKSDEILNKIQEGEYA